MATFSQDQVSPTVLPYFGTERAIPKSFQLGVSSPTNRMEC